ncbi:hypothetical protein CDA63_14515 [Hymenobacter amundsenii]|uniref:Uncharacterized protein n=1 Tax=Hymenobacter amundsenii TaxID=2006685 RepID=A0A246FIQ1_9BACT|nr:hypothetical protein [Hymenobacter amundsenii]OWP62398.1 hypothetical protein CDA63_14515 [Hymenobacter amundsenii]
MDIIRPLCTACLVLITACQPTSNSHALRLQLLADTQQRTNDNMLKQGENMLLGIKAAVERDRNQPKDIVVLEQAEKILKQTKVLTSNLRNARAELGKQLSATGQGLSDHVPVANVLLSSATATSADSLYQQSIRFGRFIRPLIAPPAEKQRLSGPNAASTPFGQLFTTAETYRKFYFEDATAVEALAVLTQQEAEVLQLSNSALGDQARLLGRGYDGFYKIYAYAVAESNTVRVGEKYKANLLLLRSSGATEKLKMGANGVAVPVSEDGRGRVEFRVARQLPPGQDSMRAFWEGTISLYVYGHDSTFRLRVPYTIRK